MFGNIGAGEMIFILAVLLLVFGAKRLPEIGGSIGKGIREFKRSMNDIQHEITKPEEPARVQAAPAPAAVQPVAQRVEHSEQG